jgi:hypothetical protein
MAVGMASSDRRRHSWMVDRDGLGRRRNRSMASGLVVDLKKLGCLHRRAKDHAPQGKVDFNRRQHSGLLLGPKSPAVAEVMQHPVCGSCLAEQWSILLKLQIKMRSLGPAQAQEGSIIRARSACPGPAERSAHLIRIEKPSRCPHASRGWIPVSSSLQPQERALRMTWSRISRRSREAGFAGSALWV